MIMPTLQTCDSRRQAHADKMRRWRSAKARKHIEGTQGAPVRQEWRGRHAWTITLHNRMTGAIHSLDLYLSAQRINSYRVTVDGKPWKDRISRSAVFAGLRKAMGRFQEFET
jgi:hypothetical protein